jgi:endoglucanase
MPGNNTRKSKRLGYYLALIAVVTTALVWTSAYLLRISTYPDARNDNRHRNYGFTRVYNVQRARNAQSGVNLGVALKDLNEGDWGLVLEDHDFDAIHDAGFYYVRVPVQFLPHLVKSGDTYQLDQDLLTRLDWVIGNIIHRDMIAILDFHFLIPEEKYSFNSKEESVEHEQKFLAVWKILAERYKDYPSSLYFELANEPHKPLMPDTWNTYVQKALDEIRSSGGNNTRRMVIVGTNVLIGSVIRSWDNVHGIRQLKLPSVEDDPNIMVTFHYYSPVPFTYQGETYTDDLERYSKHWLGNMWDNTDRQKALVRSDFDIISQWAQENKRDIILGEFGVTNYADIDSQVNWTRLIREEAESRGMIWIFWQLFYDDGNGDTLGGLYNSIGYWREEILEALLPEDGGMVSQGVQDGISDEWNEERVQKVQELISALQDPEWTTRRDAALALRALAPGADLAIPALIEALKDEEWQVRQPAVDALAAMGPASQPAIPGLIDTLKDGEWQVRRSAVDALAAIGSASQPAIPGLIEALKDGEWQIRQAAARALATMGPASQPAVPALIDTLKDEQWQVRESAALALAAIGPASQPAIPALIDALADEQWQVRKSAARALLVHGSVSQPTVPALIDALGDEEWQVRKMVVLALSCIAPDDPNVQAALQASLDDPEAQVRRVAANFLRTLDDEQ